MWNIWSARWRARREAVALARRAIPDALWRRTLKRFPFLPAPGSADEAELRRLCSLFLDSKEFSGASGLTVTDDMAVAIAAQACLPVLRLGLAAYDGFLGIVVQPSHVRTRRSQIDEDGIVHEFDDELAGEAVAGGPIMLSWRDVRSAGAKAAVGYNVVIHEFAHVLDLADGVADGVPVMPPGFPRAEWEALIQAEYRAFCQLLADLEGTDQDPGVHHNARDDRTAHTSCEPEPAFTALDPYGASAIDEFFAVASEAFFVSPGPMKTEHPALYELFTRYFSQDPNERFNSANRVVEPPRAR